MKKVLLALCFAGLFFSSVNAQNFYSESQYGSGLTVPIGNENDKYFRLITWHQFWTRFNENNTGSTRLEQPQEATTDFGLRRSRFLMYAQLNKRFLILTHFGINNQNAISGGVNPGLDGKRPQLYMHDAWAEYKVYKKYLDIGFGLHYWNGISRLTNASTLNFMTIDAPIFNWATIEATDQFARFMGIYAKGQIGRIDYRLSVNDPFKTNNAQDISVGVAQYSPFNTRKVYQGYVFYQFLEKESNILPYAVGTYLGAKKVFNVGMGFLQNSDAMWSLNAVTETNENGVDTTIFNQVFHNQLLWAIDVFLDMPLGTKGYSVTALAAYYNFNFGPNHVRNIGIMNPADGGGSLRGNAVPLLGTGDIYYIQAGTTLPKFKNGSFFQPYVAISHARFEGVKNSQEEMVPINIPDVGVNYYVAGHHAKLTLNARARPDFTNADQLQYRPEVTLQAMIFL
jgi:hypothetical protein